MPKYEYKLEMSMNALYVGDFMKYFFKSQGIEPYLPLKSEILKGIKQPSYEGNFKIFNYAMPYDIESEHLKKYRDEIRSMPIEFNWTESELKEYENLPNEDLKKRMILDKVGMKSLYLPHIKYEKDLIDYPPLPKDERAKNDFAKGYELHNNGYNEDDEEMLLSSIPYLESSASAGNYISHEMLGRYYLDILESCDNMEEELWERSAKNFMHHCQWLQKANLPAGYYLMSRYHEHYLSINEDKMSEKDYNIMYDSRIYPNMVKALELGSKDLLWELASGNGDFEWALTYMLLTGEGDGLDGLIGSSTSSYTPASPRNIATMKLGLMLGSHEVARHEAGLMTDLALHNGYKQCYFFQDSIDEGKNKYISLRTTGFYSKETNKQLRSYLGDDPFLVPEIDKLIPPSTILYTPYSSLNKISYLRDEKYSKVLDINGCYDDTNNFQSDKKFEIYKEFPYKDPRSSYSTLEHKIAFRKLMYICDMYNSLDDINKIEDNDEIDNTLKDLTGKYYESDKEYYGNGAVRNIEKLVSRSEDGKLPEEVYEFIGYANALKKRELEMNPHYYKLARPYIFPKEVYNGHPEWY